MQSAPLPAPVQASLPDLARRLGIILASLVAIVARRFLRDPRFFPIIIPLWTCITRAALRFERLTVRLAAGRIRVSDPVIASLAQRGEAIPRRFPPAARRSNPFPPVPPASCPPHRPRLAGPRPRLGGRRLRQPT